MKPHEFAQLVRQMRDAQRAYFRAKIEDWAGDDSIDLSRKLSFAKELERRVDQETKNILDGQKKLFS